jgi:hypothetical protein
MDLMGSGAAFVGLVMLGVLSLANNPIDNPNLVVIGVVYGAMLAPYRTPGERLVPGTGSHRLAMMIATGVAGTLILLANIAMGGAAIAQAQARTALAEGDNSEAIGLMGFAVAADPAMALYRRDLGVLLIDQDRGAARLELERALQLNEADAAAARALALVTAASGEREAAVEIAKHATDLRPLSPESWMTLAMVSAGDVSTIALARALRLAPWLSGSPAWPSSLPSGIGLDGVREAAAGGGWAERPRDPVGIGWLDATTDAAVSAPNAAGIRGMQDVLTCEIARADAGFLALGNDWVNSTSGIVGRVMLARLTADPTTDELIRIATLKRPDLGRAASGDVDPFSVFVDLAEDQQLYRHVGLGPIIGGPVIPRTLDALAAWMNDPRVAAARSEPQSALANCQP